MDRGETRHVILVGMMGAGKTTVARSLSQRLSRPFYDCDEQLTTRTARSGPEIALREGVAFLHQLEQEILLEALTAPEPAVSTAAGSAVESEACQRALRRSAFVVWLDAPVEILAQRMGMGGRSTRAPLRRCSRPAAPSMSRWQTPTSMRNDPSTS